MKARFKYRSASTALSTELQINRTIYLGFACYPFICIQVPINRCNCLELLSFVCLVVVGLQLNMIRREFVVSFVVIPLVTIYANKLR